MGHACGMRLRLHPRTTRGGSRIVERRARLHRRARDRKRRWRDAGALPDPGGDWTTETSPDALLTQAGAPRATRSGVPALRTDHLKELLRQGRPVQREGPFLQSATGCLHPASRTSGAACATARACTASACGCSLSADAEAGGGMGVSWPCGTSDACGMGSYSVLRIACALLAAAAGVGTAGSWCLLPVSVTARRNLNSVYQGAGTTTHGAAAACPMGAERRETRRIQRSRWRSVGRAGQPGGRFSAPLALRSGRTPACTVGRATCPRPPAALRTRRMLRAAHAPLPRQCGEGEHGVCAGGIVRKTLT